MQLTIPKKNNVNMLHVFTSIIVYGLMLWVMDYFGNIAYRKQYPQGIDGIDLLANKKKGFMSMLTKSYNAIPIFVF